ncbi:MAG: hypothetical protein IJD04_07810 [Desulfovibrionaceae bacterium]|nr:hypothetical protein [Desulfovibrionaceae bacterium]
MDVNIPFVVSTGYLPVKTQAYSRFIDRNDIPVPAEDERAVELYKAIGEIYSTREFFIPPYFDGYGELEKKFTSAQTEIFKRYRQDCLLGELPGNFEDQMFEELRTAMTR